MRRVGFIIHGVVLVACVGVGASVKWFVSFQASLTVRVSVDRLDSFVRLIVFADI
jgi:hypothetical protein